jgi:hypothetical protein
LRETALCPIDEGVSVSKIEPRRNVRDRDNFHSENSGEYRRARMPSDTLHKIAGFNQPDLFGCTDFNSFAGDRPRNLFI